MKKLIFKNLKEDKTITYEVLSWVSTMHGIYAEINRYQWEYIGIDKDMVLYAIQD